MLSKNRLWWAEIKGALEIMLRLLEGPQYTSVFYKSELTPDGVGSAQTVSRVIKVLLELNLISRDAAKMRPRIYLSLTEKGKKVAHHLKAIEEILQESSTKP